MKPDQSLFKSAISLLLTAILLLPAFAIPVFSQEPRPIVITFGQPNIWSLEQAHYLLARMHRQNLDLQTARLGDLDPNAVNASRIDILKTLLQAGVSFDQAVGLNNQLLRSDRTFNSQRRQELLANRTSLQSESTQLARDISALKIAKANASTEAERAQIQSSIDAKTEEKAAVDNQLAQTNEEAKGLTSATGNFESAKVEGSFNSKDLAGDLDSLISKVQLVNPSIAATLRLDNHIQLQYEIISKQLTLLRDEVGPGERLVFLELPQSINATQDRAENKMAQTWWRIAGYTTVDKDWLLQKELNDLAKKIEAIETALEDNQEIIMINTNLVDKNRKNRKALVDQLAKLCEEKKEREKDRDTKNKELDDLKNAKRDAQRAVDHIEKERENAKKELADAIQSGDAKKIQAARKKVAAVDARLIEANKQQEAINTQAAEACKKLEHDLDELEKSLKLIDETIKDVQRGIQRIDDQAIKLKKDRARLIQAFASLSTKFEKLRLEKVRDKIREQQDIADRLMQGGSANTDHVVDQTFELLKTESNFRGAVIRESKDVKDAKAAKAQKQCGKGIEKSTEENAKDASNCQYRTFVNLEEEEDPELKSDSDTGDKDTSKALLRKRSIRTVDIIPRQNAINVQDTKQTVSKTGIFAAVSFLFGFAGKFTYERQREHAEQFLNQELFTSGFGKGEKDFGWSFYPFAGTRQLSSGVRTTYAVAIIPDNAESVILKARGCYFPRKENQPVNYEQAGREDWTSENRVSRRLCTASERVFVLPVPGGTGDGADYYITGMRYAANRGAGERMIASIQGQNLPSQVGIMINGVPLREAVGLGQLNIESILDDSKTRDNCVGDICGRFERIDAHEIVISFKMPNDFTGSPKIGVIGPGKSIELNKLSLTINGQEDVQLDSAEMMFGDPPDSTLRRITDFRVAPPQPAATETTGVLTGSRFKPTDTFHVNGQEAKPVSPCRSDLCILKFPTQTGDFLAVTISPAEPKERAVSKTFVNPSNLGIISAEVVSFTPPEGPRVGVLTVKLDGSGFDPDLKVKLRGGKPDPEMTVPSAGQMFLKIMDPEAVVHINITDTSSNRTVSTVVVRPEPPPKDKK